MSDRITAEERALIDAALAGGPGQVVPAGLPKRPGRKPHVSERRGKVATLAAAGLTARQMSERIGAPEATVRNDLRALKIRPAPAPRGPKPRDRAAEPIDARKRRRAAAKRDKLQKVLRDRRRFKDATPARGSYAREVAAETAGTVFPGKLAEAGPGDRVLKHGSNSQKIGGVVLTGRLKGAPIYTLTLEERATCPRSCSHWRGCYGNAMPFATRWRHGPMFEAKLEEEVTDLCATHGRVLIRLHVLGDFYSVGYVDLWGRMLARHAGLYVFGFTAHAARGASPFSRTVGSALSEVRAAFPRRFMIRNSGRTGTWGSFDITDPFPEKTIGDAIVCPEQREANLGPSTRHCGDCAACWSTDRPIAFIRH